MYGIYSVSYKLITKMRFVYILVNYFNPDRKMIRKSFEKSKEYSAIRSNSKNIYLEFECAL